MCSFAHLLCLVCVLCFVRIQKLPRLLVASSDGYLYIYNVDPQDGGECVLVQKHRCVRAYLWTVSHNKYLKSTINCHQVSTKYLKSYYATSHYFHNSLLPEGKLVTVGSYSQWYLPTLFLQAV